MSEADRPIQSPPEFFGRRGLVRRIAARMGAERPQSVAVIGGRRAGKTSLLNFLSHPETVSELLPAKKNLTILRIDTAACASGVAADFLAALARTLADAGHPADDSSYEAIRGAVQRAHDVGEALILLLDDFHLVTSSAAFTLEFFSFLRSLANNFNLAYITTSFLELQRLCVAKDVQESPFFNIFTNMALGPLAHEEGEALLSSLLGAAPAEVGKVVAWCGTMPYALKIAARCLQGVPSDRWTEAELERRLLPELAGYYDEVVAILPPEAMRPLRTLARGREVPPQEAHLLRPLVRQGFLVEQDRFRCYAPSLAAYLEHHLDPSRLRGRL